MFASSLARSSRKLQALPRLSCSSLEVGQSGLRPGMARIQLEQSFIACDRLIDVICAWGDADTLRQKLDKYFEAGATHVVLYPCNPDESYSVESPVSKNWNWPLLEAMAPRG